MDQYLNVSVRIDVTHIEGYEIEATLGLTYNTYDFNYLILQIVALSLVGICLFAILFFELKQKIRNYNN